LRSLGSGRSAAASGCLRRAPARRAVLGAVAVAALLCGTRATQDAVANGDTRTISIFHTHTKENASITFKRNGYYDQSGLEKLNWLLRDWRNDRPTKMEPRLFDIVWEVYRSVGASEPVHVVSAYRAPETNAMLRRRSRAVSEFSQHMAGKALDFYLPDVDMARVRSAGMRLQHGGVGFYPNSAHSFVHLDAGSVRAWPRMTRGQLMALFPDGKTVHLPTDNKPLARYEEARAEILAKGGAVSGMAYASAEDSGGRRSLWATLFGGGGEDEDFYGTRGRGGRGRAAQEAAAYVPSSGDDGGTRGVLAFAAPEPSRGLSRRAPAPAPAEASAAAQTAAIAPKEAAPAEDGAALASVPLPPKRPGDVIDIAALAFMPMPPARPIELASAMIGPPTRSDATAGAFSARALPERALPETPAARLTSEERIHLRALFATVASGAAPGPRVKIATARAKPQAGAPGGHVAAASAGLALGFSAKAPDLPGDRFAGPAVKPLPVLR
jgi:uncharacterized protein YcbK (DUF882 family)